jgi:PAS domain S-box-containing protein
MADEPDRGAPSEEDAANFFQRMMSATRELIGFWAHRPFAFARPEAALGEEPADVRRFFTVLAERARELVGAELGAVGVGTSPAQPFEPWVAVGIPREIERAIGKTPRPVGTLGAVAIRGEIIRVEDLRRHPSFVGLPPSHPDVRSLLAVPLRFFGETVGNLYLANKRGANEFSRVDQIVVEMLGMVSVMSATTERDRSRLHDVMEALPDGFAFVDKETGYVLANRAFGELFGAEQVPERGVSQEVGTVFSPEGDPLPVEDLPSSRALADEIAVDRELLLVWRDGRRIPVRARAAPVRSVEGAVVGAVVTYRDILSHKRLLSRIEGDRRTVHTIIEAAPDGIFFLDLTTGKVIANRAFQVLTGKPIDPDGGLEQRVGTVCWPDGRSVSLEELPSFRAVREGVQVDEDLVFLHTNGRRIPVTVRAAPTCGADGAVTGVVLTCRDASAQQELIRLREEFAAMVAHDLRNPIQSMLVQIALLRATAERGEPVPEPALERLERLGERLARMASDLLDASRLELSRLPLDLAPTDLVEVVRAVVDRVRSTAGDHPIDLRVEAPAPVLIDAARFDQILTNLLENAVKYSAPGMGIDVTVQGADGGVDVAVRDRGPGIPLEDVPKLFDRFYQAGRARAKRSGLGLGLYIAKGFVEAHGGQIRVETAPGEGSTFHVWLPAAAQRAASTR